VANNSADSNETLAMEQRISPRKGRHLLAAVFSAIAPGTGQILLGAKRKGFLLLFAFGLLVVAMWPGRVLATYPGYLLSTFAFLILLPYASWTALLGRSKPAGARPSGWWLLLFIPIAILSMALEYRLLVGAAGFRHFGIPSTSMEKTLLQGDRFVVDMRYYMYRPPSRGDIVVFSRDNTYFVKRVIAVAGDTIQGRNGTVSLNGDVLSEPYIQHINGGSNAPELNTFGPITVPPGQCFVMGDNRDVSYDSRSHDFGLVKGETISGKPLYISLAARSGRILR